jgi:hypothetical protein
VVAAAPELPAFILPGFARPYSPSSLRLFTGRPGYTAQKKPKLPMPPIGVRSLSGSKGTFLRSDGSADTCV